MKAEDREPLAQALFDAGYGVGEQVDIDRLKAKLAALGYEVRPIAHFVGDDCTEEDIAHFAALERAAEAADREADYQRFLYPKGKPARGIHQAAEAADREAAGVVGGMESPDRRELPSAAVAHDPTICTGTDAVPCGCGCFDCNERGIHQAAEAADAAAEAAYQDSQNTDPQYREQRAYERGVVDEARRHPDQHPSAAAAPLEPIPTDWGVGPLTHPAAVAPSSAEVGGSLDVEALAAALHGQLCSMGQDHRPYDNGDLTCVAVATAAYADAIRKRGGA